MEETIFWSLLQTLYRRDHQIQLLRDNRRFLGHGEPAFLHCKAFNTFHVEKPLITILAPAIHFWHLAKIKTLS